MSSLSLILKTFQMPRHFTSSSQFTHDKQDVRCMERYVPSNDISTNTKKLHKLLTLEGLPRGVHLSTFECSVFLGYDACYVGAKVSQGQHVVICQRHAWTQAESQLLFFKKKFMQCYRQSKSSPSFSFQDKYIAYFLIIACHC